MPERLSLLLRKSVLFEVNRTLVDSPQTSPIVGENPVGLRRTLSKRISFPHLKRSLLRFKNVPWSSVLNVAQLNNHQKPSRNTKVKTSGVELIWAVSAFYQMPCPERR